MKPQPPVTSAPSNSSGATTCPACGAAASGRFCASCGAALAGSTCASCKSPLTPGAKFCHNCGAATSGAPASAKPSSLPWLVAAVALLTMFAMLAGRAFSSRQSAGVASDSGVQVAPEDAVPAEQSTAVRAPDISSLSPEERADRLFNRVMLLSSQGKSDSVQFFAPMALTAYQMLGSLNADQRYDMGRIAEAAGAIPLAKAQADSILAKNPTHLLGLILAARVASLEKNTAQVRAFEKRLVAAANAELAKKLDEYDRHRADITTGLADARRDLGAAQ